MTLQKASVTATIMAFHRAIEMLYPENQRVCSDPIAVSLLPADWAALLNDLDQLRKVMEPKAKEFPGINGAVVSRVRFIDDIVADSLKKGTQQIVIPGAGYDSRAFRINGISESVTVFELDHPVTQEEKLNRLDSQLKDKGHVKYIPIDLAKENMKERLIQNGFDKDLKTLFILEGLVPYIPIEAFEELLNFVAGDYSVENSVVFDYLPPSVVNGTSELIEGKNMYKEVQLSGENFKLGFEKEVLEKLLIEKGFQVLQNVNAPDLKDNYFKNCTMQRPISSVFWFAHAEVKAKN